MGRRQYVFFSKKKAFSMSQCFLFILMKEYVTFVESKIFLGLYIMCAIFLQKWVDKMLGKISFLSVKHVILGDTVDRFFGIRIFIIDKLIVRLLFKAILFTKTNGWKDFTGQIFFIFFFFLNKYWIHDGIFKFLRIKVDLDTQCLSNWRFLFL